MEATKVKLLNKLTQNYLNKLQAGEKNKNGNFVFSGDGYYADFSADNWTYTGEMKCYKTDEIYKQIDQFKEYIDKNGVDDKFLQEFSDGFKSAQYPNFVVESVVKYICELNKPKYILKLLDLEHCFWYRINWGVIIKSNNPEYIKLAIEKIKPYKYKEDYKYSYKELKKAYKQAVKSNKAGV